MQEKETVRKLKHGDQEAFAFFIQSLLETSL